MSGESRRRRILWVLLGAIAIAFVTIDLVYTRRNSTGELPRTKLRKSRKQMDIEGDLRPGPLGTSFDTHYPA